MLRYGEIPLKIFLVLRKNKESDVSSKVHREIFITKTHRSEHPDLKVGVLNPGKIASEISHKEIHSIKYGVFIKNLIFKRGITSLYKISITFKISHIILTYGKKTS